MKPYPQWICSFCGEKYGRNPEGRLCTWHENTCDICGDKGYVAEPRDFGHLKDSWQNHEED